MRTPFLLTLLLLTACGEPPVSVTEAPSTRNSYKRKTELIEEVPAAPRTIERTDSILIEIREAGTGRQLRVGDRVSAQVVARVSESETPFLSTRISGRPVTYSLDVSAPDTPVEGLRRALTELRVGTLADIKIPAELAYGEAGLEAAGIPPNSELEFEVRIKRMLKP